MDLLGNLGKIKDLAEDSNMYAIPFLICGLVLQNSSWLKLFPIYPFQSASFLSIFLLIVTISISVLFAYVINLLLGCVYYTLNDYWQLHCAVSNALLGFCILGLVQTSFSLKSPLTFYCLSGSCVAIQFFLESAQSESKVKA